MTEQGDAVIDTRTSRALNAFHSPVERTRVVTSPVTRRLTHRSAIGLVAVLLGAIILAWRIERISREPRVELAPRVAQLMYNRMLASRIYAYAREYGRPAYYLDSVQAHLDSAEAKLVSELRTDLWGDSVGYFWSYCWFSLWSRAGTRPQAMPTPPESIPPGRLFALRGEIREDYAWPPGVGRAANCFGGS